MLRSSSTRAMFLRTAWLLLSGRVMVAQTGSLPPPPQSAIDVSELRRFWLPTLKIMQSEDMSRGVRDLVRGLDRAALGTALPGEGGTWAYASLGLAAVAHDLSPILLLSDLAEHTKAIANDDRVSLLFDGTHGLAQPLTGPRVTLRGRAARVAVERAHLVAGFGKIRWLSAAELGATPASGLADAEEGIVSHMNDDHGDAVQLYAGKLLGLDGSGWRMTGIDAEGIDLRRGGQVARLAFDAPLGAASEARKVLVALVNK